MYDNTILCFNSKYILTCLQVNINFWRRRHWIRLTDWYVS